MDFNAALFDAEDRVPVHRDPYDLSPVKERLARFEVAILHMQEKAVAHDVTDDASLEAAVAMATQAKGLNKDIETRRKEIIADPYKFMKAVNGMAKGFQAKLDGIENDLRKKVSDFSYRRELKRREEERKAREEAARLQKKLDEEAKEKKVEPVQVVVPVAPPPPKVTRTESGSAHQRKQWTFKVADETKVPRDYLTVDERRIREAVKMGVRSIEGVEIYEETTTVFRT